MRTSQETVIQTPSSDLGPFEPGKIFPLAFYHPWTVPEQPDVYQLRIYSGGQIVASALFEVKIPDLVDYIYIEKEQFPPEKLPIFIEPNPHPEGIVRTFLTGDNIILDIGFSEIKEPIIFSRYVLINRDTSNGTETSLPGKLGPFGPRARDGILQIKEGPWPVPDQPGIYELRVYFGDNVVASAAFQVKLTPPDK